MLEQLIAQLQRANSVDFSVRVRPHASVTRVTGIMADGSAKVDVHAPAEDDKGNEALITFLAQEFGVPRSNIEILSGKTNRKKLVRITNRTPQPRKAAT